MSILTNVGDQVRSAFAPAADVIKRKVFGVNNERLDFVMDSFSKLPPQHQTGVIVGLGAGLLVVVLGALGFYFSRINALETELNTGFDALQDLRVLSAEYRKEKDNLDWLVRSVERKTSDLKPKPFFEQKANQLGVTLEALRSDEAPISEDNPLSREFKNVVVEFRMPKVSIPRMLNFLGEIEKSDKTLTVQDLQIRARYGDRLYFETQAKINGYKVGS